MDSLELLREKLDELRDHQNALAETLAGFQRSVEGRMAELIESARPGKPIRPASPTDERAAWPRVILGEELAGMPALESVRGQLLRAILAGEPAACGLAGQLLVFQSAAAEKMPQLLKEIGEAYYRWQPRSRPGAPPFETALARWVQRRCDDAGVPNTIELVEPGQRFDSARHNATSRGVEITEVFGWVVLRDNGKVYTKATVGVR